MCDDRPWKLIAPWWAWPRLGTPGRDVRATAPVVQMYDTSDPVSLFVADPQKALAYGPDDVVQRVVELPASTPATRLSRFVLQPTDTRKHFLPTHRRFYLVVCELHCDSPGLPSVRRDKACQAGFVVRRRRLSFSEADGPAAAALVRRAGELTGRIARIDRGREERLLKKRARVGRGGVFGAMAAASSGIVALDSAAVEKRAALETELAGVRAELRKWHADAGAVTVSEGWVPSAVRDVGAWEPVDETPDELSESVYPLYPLVPDPRSPAHDAAGKTLYFGLLPAASRETSASGEARFDDRSRYQVRCFVRRHRCACPRTREANDCGGELVWSAAAEAYQLASHFDPAGTGNAPVTIQLPDLQALAATVGARLPVQMVSPGGSAMSFKVVDGKPESGSLGANQQICFFSIPLITIIAYFVLNLFLPIVVFLFGLWFLLGLKLCIPPSISFSADAQLHADIEGELSLEIDAAVSASIDLNTVGDIGLLAAADVGTVGLGDSGLVNPNDLENPALVPGSPAASLHGGFTNTVLVGLKGTVTEDREDEARGAPLDQAVYVPRVERWEVGA